ncbi:MAG: AAA family ATPase [Acidaminococcaceae bacterium]|nr:AAA family ATPase [Acidaminococcaceae bacterium]
MKQKTERQQIDSRIPRYSKLLQPTFHALKALGGSGKNREILNQIIKDLEITEEVASILHKGNPNKTELEYQADWARTYLRIYGVIKNSARSEWTIMPDYKDVEVLDEDLIIKSVQNNKTPDDEQKPETSNVAGRIFLFKKNVDQSLLKAGLTVPKKKNVAVLEALSITLAKGEKANINILIEGKRYDGAVLTHVNYDENVSTREVLQIRYSENSAVCEKLKQIFSYSQAKLENNESKSLNEENIDIYAVGPSTIDFVCYPKYQTKAKPGGEKVLTIKETIHNIKQYIATKGFSYEDGLIENFYLSLKSKPFVILAGTSGTGKTRLVKLFAEAIGATSENGRYQMVSVRPDWSDSTDLFGHVDLNNHFVPGAIIDFVKKAEFDVNHPYILCLDEMNLARVEYYLSDFLSVIETRDFDGYGNIKTAQLVPESYYGMDKTAAGKYGKVTLPENLYVVGTVNMDETTFPFSKKVLDRANTIEFSYVDLMPQSMEAQQVSAMNLSNQFLKTKYLLLQQCQDEVEDVNRICAELKVINEILQLANAHVGYRIRDEIVFYLLNNNEESLISEAEAFDNELMQKILPRIRGSSSAVKSMLCELFKFCAGDYEGYQTKSDDISSKMLEAAKRPECKYKKSAEKIAFMVRRYEEDGFTSYWL